MPNPSKSKRARRRKEAERMRRRAESVVRRFWSEADEAFVAGVSRRLRDHLRDCSCPKCCNPRRSHLSRGWQRLTLQERRVQLPDT